MNILIINGPNLNLLGKREPTIYGNASFEDYFESLQEQFSQVNLTYFQSNIEGEIIDKLHEVGFDYDGIVLNAAAYTHTSVGIGDAVKATETPVIEGATVSFVAEFVFEFVTALTPSSATS